MTDISGRATAHALTRLASGAGAPELATIWPLASVTAGTLEGHDSANRREKTAEDGEHVATE